MRSETPDAQAQRLDWLLRMLGGAPRLPASLAEKRRLLRALMNLHSGEGLPPAFFALPDKDAASGIGRGL